MFPLYLKHPAAIFFLIICLFHHTFSEANSTLTQQLPAVEYDPSDSLWLENSAGYGGSDSYDFSKKPPHGYGGVAALHISRWLVPVLEYSMIAQGDRLRFQVIPVITWLAVVLETTANMWFHDQLVRDWMDRQGAKVIGDPVFMAEVADNDTSATGPASGSVSGKSGQHSSMDITTSPKMLTSGLNPESRKRHKKGEDKVIHLCGSKSCPACNYESCHCPNCPPSEVVIEQQRFRLGNLDISGGNNYEAMEDSPPSKKLKPENTERAFTDKTPSPAGEPECSVDSYGSYDSIRSDHSEDIKEVIPLDNGNLLSWAKKGNIKFWSVQGESLVSVDEIPIEQSKIIFEVFVIDNDHVVTLVMDQEYLEEWKKIAGFWQSKTISSNNHLVEQLPNRQLVTYSRNDRSLKVWTAGEQWLVFTEIPIEMHDFRIKSLLAVSETQFIAFFYQSDPDQDKETKVCLRWRKENESWTSEVCYTSNHENPVLGIYVLSDQTLFIVERRSQEAWLERSDQRSKLPQEEFSLFRFLPDKRLYTTESMFWWTRSLRLLSEVEGQWQISELYRPREEELLCDVVILDNERLVLAINRDTDPDRSSVEDMEKHSILIFREEQGAWHREPLVYFDSQILGMTVQHGVWLITWHANGTIRTWNLFP